MKYAGEEAQEKYSKIAKKIDKKADALLITTLDDINWLLNLRGRDIPYNPVFISYAIFYPQTLEVKLFVDSDKV